MERPPEHLALLARTGYPVPVHAYLSQQDRDILHKFGFWLEGLARGTIAPVTEDQEHFVKVSRGHAEPTNAFEQAWCRFQQSPSDAPPMAISALVDVLNIARERARVDDEEYRRKREAILAPLREQLDALENEYASRAEKLADEIAKLEADVRLAVIARGRSYYRGDLHALLTRQRVTWDSKGLAVYSETHPEIVQFKRIHGPTVALRYKPAGEE